MEVPVREPAVPIVSAPPLIVVVPLKAEAALSVSVPPPTVSDPPEVTPPVSVVVPLTVRLLPARLTCWTRVRALADAFVQTCAPLAAIATPLVALPMVTAPAFELTKIPPVPSVSVCEVVEEL